MSLQYIIDGYNLIKHPLFNEHLTKKSKDSRAILLDYIRVNRLCGSSKNKVSVVFDGYPDLTNKELNNKDIDIVFSKSQTADERIKKIVESVDNPKNIIVISDDKEIKFSVKVIGARIKSIEEFLAPKASTKKKESSLIPKPEITYTQMQKINEELRKIWLK